MHRYRSHTCGALRETDVGEAVRLSGWVHRVRDHGGLLFIDLRDHYGVTQCVADPDSPAFAAAETVRAEWVIRVDGDYRAGAALTNVVQDPSGPVEMTATVAKLTPEAELNQKGGMFGLLTFDHQWLLEPTDGGTKVIQHEVDRGLYMWFWDSSWVQPAYESVSQALKTRVLDLSDNEGGG